MTPGRTIVDLLFAGADKNFSSEAMDTPQGQPYQDPFQEVPTTNAPIGEGLVSPPPEGQKPRPPKSSAIKTLQSDVETFVQGERTSLISVLVKEAEKNTMPGQPEKPSALARWFGKIGIIVGFLVLAAASVFLYNFIKSRIPPTPPPINAPEDHIPLRAERKVQMVVGLESTPTLSLLQNVSRQQQDAGTLTEIELLDQQQKDIDPKKISSLLGLALPQDVVNQFQQVKLFMSYSFFGGRLLLAANIAQPQQVISSLSQAESSLAQGLQPLLLEAGDVLQGMFISDSYRNVDFRAFTVSRDRDQVLIWGVVPFRRMLLLSSSQRGFELVVERLFE